ncbi:TM2 domain-containing protein [Idiomarina sp. HP20-50]|uniref:TM2 domain-containing protein n=1 Tax=Idiomarina sp. HP20-50 TaxID=3070813 RepID=UPI00294B15EB|nr:TM2 domain-containing protein [Idiomarina sp. HP20-50]MDV6315736.1 TM2 domain-containing protein [Idiomarina sp. HP20-50]
MSDKMSSEQLRDEEEALRTKIRELTPEQRKEYYRLEGQRLKDPDTYAVLNWFVMAGLHHFYLGKTQRGVINLCVMLLGLAMLPFLPLLGIIILLAIVIIELPQLFKSQQIVHAYNNNLMRELIDEVKSSHT